MNNLSTDIRISVSASYNRAAQILAAMIRDGYNGTYVETLDLYARDIFKKEQAFLQELSEAAKPPTPRPTQKIDPVFKSRKQLIEEQENGIALDNLDEELPTQEV